MALGMRQFRPDDKVSKREREFWATYDETVAPFLKESLDNDPTMDQTTDMETEMEVTHITVVVTVDPDQAQGDEVEMVEDMIDDALRGYKLPGVKLEWFR